MFHPTTSETNTQLIPSAPDSITQPLNGLTQRSDQGTALTNLSTKTVSDYLMPNAVARAELADESLFNSSGISQATPLTRTQDDMLTGTERRASLISHSDDALTQNRQPASSSRSRQAREPRNALANAQKVGTLTETQTFSGQVNRRDRNDFFRFDVTDKSRFSLALNGLRADADVQLLNAAGETVGYSVHTGRKAESMQLNLEAGTYYAQVYSYEGATTRYSLSLSANPITPPGPQQENWTIMVYMAGDNLEEFGIEDFQELAAIGSNSNVNVVVQFDRTAGIDSSFGDWTDTRRGLVNRGDTPGLNWGTSIGEANMGDANTLQDFVNWGMSNYQADHYAVVNWGHGSGFDVSYDDQTEDSISASELNTVLSNLPTKVDLVGADACLMSTTEFAYEISDNASVFVGSQELEPGTGWDYTRLLSDLETTPTMTAFQLGETIVEGYASYYNANGDGTETLSAINLSALQGYSPNSLSSTLSRFASSVMSTATSFDLSQLGSYRNFFADAFGAGNFPDYCDIGNLFTTIGQDKLLSNTIQTAAQAVLNAYNSVVVANYSASPGSSTGLSLYFSERGIYPAADYNSSNLSFAADTQWDNLLNWVSW